VYCKGICGSEGKTLHIFSTLAPHVDVSQPHVAAALTYEKISRVQKTEDCVDLIPDLDVVR